MPVFVPNLLTVMRLGLVPLLVILLYREEYMQALIVFLVAGVSDGLDGFIAKRFNCETRLGAMLDPLADKALLISAYIMLATLEKVPFWLMIVVVFRDVVILTGCLLITLVDKAPEMLPSRTSKINTFLQIVTVIAVLIWLAGAQFLEPWLVFLYFGVLVFFSAQRGVVCLALGFFTKPQPWHV